MGRVCIVFRLEHQRGAMQRKSRRFHHPRQFQPRHQMRLLLQQLHHLPHHPTESQGAASNRSDSGRDWEFAFPHESDFGSKLLNRSLTSIYRELNFHAILVS